MDSKQALVIVRNPILQPRYIKEASQKFATQEAKIIPMYTCIKNTGRTISFFKRTGNEDFEDPNRRA
jgi:hypothetical protein